MIKVISNHIKLAEILLSGAELPQPPYYNHIKIRDTIVLFTFLLQQIRIILTVLRFCDWN